MQCNDPSSTGRRRASSARRTDPSTLEVASSTRDQNNPDACHARPHGKPCKRVSCVSFHTGNRRDGYGYVALCEECLAGIVHASKVTP